MSGLLFGKSVMAAAVLALVLDALIGDPKWLWGRIPHPVGWIAWIAKGREQALNAGPQRTQKGALAWVRVVMLFTLLALIVQMLLLSLPAPFGWIAMGVIAMPWLAARSLDQHVRAVARGLVQDVATGRAAVAQIVGRDTQTLDEAGVGRAAVESLAENSSDGLVAPLFWLLVLGLPGLVAYKAINTLDSLWGYRNERFEQFGKVAAKVDDFANFIPARLTAFFVSLVTGHFGPLAAAVRDAGGHRSPNAGWPEAAFASALRLSLAGPRLYDGEMSQDAAMGQGTRQVGPGHIRAALRLFWFVWAALVILCLTILMLHMLRAG